MSTSSLKNSAIFLVICGAATTYHVYSQAKAWMKKRPVKHPTANDTKPKLVVISGCDHGFGYILAKALVKEPEYLILALALTEQGVGALQSLQKKHTQQEQSSPKLVAIRCDVTSDDDVQRVGEVTREILEENNAVLYSIVNNAGIAAGGDFLFFNDISTHQKVMDVNFFGQLRLTKTLLPWMLETSRDLSTHSPRIINLSSVCGVAASASNSTYNASKFAVEAWSDSLRLELEPFHIKVIKIRPGQANTQIQKNWAITYLQNFATAPTPIQELYGGDAFVTGVKKVLQSMGDGSSASPPELVVDMLVQTLKMPHFRLKAAYFVGADAQTVWRACGALPVTVSDTIKRFLRFRYPVLPPTIVESI